MHSNLIDDLAKRESEIKFHTKFIDLHKFSHSFISHLSLKQSLKEHEGCVNTLDWNSSGMKLASGSDDLMICIWDPFKEKLIQKIETKHRGNIFSVRFLNDYLIASCAADRDIYVYDLNKKQNLNEIHAHTNRVKRLVTIKDIPYIIFSAGEDGLVLQHDIRAPSNEVTKLLLNYTIGSNFSETKCLSINENKPHLLAVGCNDPFARVYDRRMIKLKSFSSRITSSDVSANESSKYLFEFDLLQNMEKIPLNYYVPGHLPKKIYEYNKRMKTLSVTFLTFSTDSNELLVNLGGEQLYLYDLDGKNPEASLKYNSYKEFFNDFISSDTSVISDLETNSTNSKTKQKKKIKLCQKAEILKSKANESFEQQNFLEAVESYNEAIKVAPDSAILYGNRAAALMKRNWDGDTYMAMKDCYMALKLDPDHLKSHFRLSRCLSDLKWYEDAQNCLEIFRKRFPDYANSNACENLFNEINSGLVGIKKQSSKIKKNSKKKVKHIHANDEMNSAESSSSDDSSLDENEDKELDKNNNLSLNKKEQKVLFKKYKKQKVNALDFKSRYCGHCNVATDIKEACFLGKDFIAAGSDDGSFYIWNRHTTNVVRVLKGDESIVNCLAPHPFAPVLASSGIDSDVKIWTPKFPDYEIENEIKNDRIVLDVKSASLNNQLQMNSHPFEFLLLNLNQNAQSKYDLKKKDVDASSNESVACRPS